MVGRGRLGEDEIDKALAKLSGWRVSEDNTTLTKSFGFVDFQEAFAFMTRVALFAESIDHHPDWSNSYSRVEVKLTTHDAGGLTERDIRLAEAMDTFSGAAG